MRVQNGPGSCSERSRTRTPASRDMRASFETSYAIVPPMDKGFPLSMDRAVFVADAHLNRDDDHTRAFVSLAERAAAENAALFMLGDMFDLWFGTPGLAFGFQEPVIARLRELR